MLSNRRSKDQEMASMMKRQGIERTTGKCPKCYATISVQGPKSRYSHNVVSCGTGSRQYGE